MWLGNDEIQDDKSYYSPFMNLNPEDLDLSEGEKDRLKMQIEALNDKTLIRIVTDGEDSGLDSVQALVANGGYKLALVRLSDYKFAVIIRDIQGEMKDDMGRSIPFVMYMVIEGEDDALAISNYLMDNLRKIDHIFGGLFAYDGGLNCLTFNIAKMDGIMKEASEYATRHFDLNPEKAHTIGPELLMVVTNNSTGIDKLFRSIPAGTSGCQLFNFSLTPLNRVDHSGNFDSSARYDKREAYSCSHSSGEASWGIKEGIKQHVEHFLRYIENLFGNAISEADKKDFATIRKSISNIINRRYG